MYTIKITKNIFTFSLVFVLSYSTLIASDKTTNVTYSEQPFSVTEIIENTCKELDLHQNNLFLKLKSLFSTPQTTQTLSYLNRTGLKNRLNIYNEKIKNMNPKFFKDLFKTIIQKELDFQKTSYVFYHGQQREFLLFQDIYQGLFEISNKKTLYDFIAVRTPNKKFEKFNNVTDFLKKQIEKGTFNKASWFDQIAKIKNRLLAVNPSLFGNSYIPGESSFAYFLYSINASHTDISKSISDSFDLFDLSELYQKYNTQIQELLTLLSEYEKDKTGILLQIFIPKSLVNEIAYRCNPGGFLYHKNLEQIHPSQDLETYLYEKPSIFFTLYNDYKYSNYSFDETQFRLLINSKMLNPDSGIKFFRYYNETKNIKIYKEKLNTLLSEILKDVIKSSQA